MEAEYAVLRYYKNILSDDYINIGILVFDKTAKKLKFKYISDFSTLEKYDEEIDICFIKAYLQGMKQMFMQNAQKISSIKELTKIYVNELRFSEIETINKIATRKNKT